MFQSNEEQVILAVVRGELALNKLDTVGVFVVIIDSPGGKVCKVQSRTPIVVNITVVDIAKGLLALRFSQHELMNWAVFIFATDVIDMEQVHEHAQSEIVLDALWVAAFEGEVRKDAVDVLDNLIHQINT